MNDTIKSSSNFPWDTSWVRRRFQRKGLGFGRGLVLAVPASILFWIVIAFSLSTS